MTKLQILKHLEWLKLYRSLLISGVANGAIKQILALKAENDRMIEALNEISSWEEGNIITSRFDEPYSARKARKVLSELALVTEQ